REPEADRAFQRRRSIAGDTNALGGPSQSQSTPKRAGPTMTEANANFQYVHPSQNGYKPSVQNHGSQYPTQHAYARSFPAYGPAPVYSNNQGAYYYPQVPLQPSNPPLHNPQSRVPAAHTIHDQLSVQGVPQPPPQIMPPQQFFPPPPPQNFDVRAAYRLGSRSKLPFPKVSQARRPTADPVGLLTSVSHAVVDALRRGWSEVIPLGHFSRRYSPLVSSHTPSLDSNSSITIGEGGQVSLKNKHLPEIPIESLTLNDWNEIKRNMPRAIREHLIPEGEVLPGSEDALAAADMIENLFNIIDNQNRLGSEFVPLMIYADQKIRFWRARWEQDERCDIFDPLVYRDIYEEWKRVEEEKREKERYSKSAKGTSFQSGSFQSG
ncbi:hypothetical protein EV361DRAFT_226700, partial [Lentinula raphanica]